MGDVCVGSPNEGNHTEMASLCAGNSKMNKGMLE